MMNFKKLSFLIVAGVVSAVIIYALLLIVIISPIGEISIDNAGMFGDSFGILTSLFSGLAFSGVIITILLQREELKLQRIELAESRKEFSKSAIAQERSAQLSALSTMLVEHRTHIQINQKILKDHDIDEDHERRINSEINHKFREVEKTRGEIYRILEETGINPFDI